MLCAHGFPRPPLFQKLSSVTFSVPLQPDVTLDANEDSHEQHPGPAYGVMEVGIAPGEASRVPYSGALLLPRRFHEHFRWRSLIHGSGTQYEGFSQDLNQRSQKVQAAPVSVVLVRVSPQSLPLQMFLPLRRAHSFPLQHCTLDCDAHFPPRMTWTVQVVLHSMMWEGAQASAVV